MNEMTMLTAKDFATDQESAGARAAAIMPC
jgi:hypothetical protein